MKITDATCTFTAEKLNKPFGFKGGFLSELWQVVCKVKAEDTVGVGVGVQSVLWSDEHIFTTTTEQVGNAMMLKTTEYATKLLIGKTFTNPIYLSNEIFSQVYEYAKSITNSNELRTTFARNAMVAVDNALWQIYAKLCGKTDLIDLVGKDYSYCLNNKQTILSNVPLVSYNVNDEDIEQLIKEGAILLKIKIGFDDGGKLNKEQMLEWDKKRITQIHNIAKKYKTEYSTSGKILYYLDANGKYDTLDRVENLVNHTKNIGAFENIILFEEPFPEDVKLNVSSIPIRFAADESVHSVEDVKERISLGYTAITLKPIAKTLSETLKILKVATENNVHCFCADLTVNPLLVEWNKNVAARINSLPELKIGILESNGAQNYANWTQLKTYHPTYNKSYTKCDKGLYKLDNEFFETSGGIFNQSNYYDNLL